MEDEQPRSDRPMYDATCTQCGQPCQVPFQPSPGRPVYCKNCFRPRSRNSRFGRGGGRGDRQ